MNCLSSISYDGSRFHGFPAQPKLHTIQGYLGGALSDFFQQPVAIFSHSRTDRGVHALDQKIQFQIQTGIPPQKLPRILNPKLEHVRLNWVEQREDDFSLSKVMLSKVYQYRILFEEPYPFLAPYAWCPPFEKPEFEHFAQVLNHYRGIHNFEILSRRDRSRNIQSFFREIISSAVVESGKEWLVTIEGTGFLWGMVRHMVAYAMACTRGKLSMEELALMLEGPEVFQKPKPSIKPAPGAGLYLSQTRIL